jgi:hypothetical protein
VYTSLICSLPILEPERHLGVTENPERCDECCFFFIVNGEVDLGGRRTLIGVMEVLDEHGTQLKLGVNGSLG